MVLIGVGRCGRKFPFIWMFCTPILECLGRHGMHSARKLFTMYYLSLVSGVPQNFSSQTSFHKKNTFRELYGRFACGSPRSSLSGHAPSCSPRRFACDGSRAGNFAVLAPPNFTLSHLEEQQGAKLSKRKSRYEPCFFFLLERIIAN